MREWWTRLGSNQRPLRCQRSALPLSYASASKLVGVRERGDITGRYGRSKTASMGTISRRLFDQAIALTNMEV